MSRYIAEAKSRKEIRQLAMVFRSIFKLDAVLYFPVVEILDALPEIFSTFSYEIVPDNTFPEYKHAETNITTGQISIKQSVYDGACSGNGRDRLTIAM